MRLLLDTHVLHDMLFKPAKLPPRVRAAILSPANPILASAISPYELEFKKTIGKLSFPTVGDWTAAIVRPGFAVLDVTVAHGVAAARLPLHHRDPWDRMLVAQAAIEALVLISDDKALRPYGVPLFW